MEPKNCMTCVYSGCDGLTVCKDCNDFSHHEYKPVCYEREIQSLKEEMAAGNEMIMKECYAWMARAEKAEAELETSKKLYAKKCDQHMETEQELEAVKNVLANVKGVANFYNSEHHANYNYEGKVFAKDLNKMLKGKGE